MWAYVLSGVLGTAVGWVVLGGVRVINQVERGVVFRFGKARRQVRQPGLAVLVPLADRLKKVNVQIVTMPVPTQEGITRDNVSVRVDAVVYFARPRSASRPRRTSSPAATDIATLST